MTSKHQLRVCSVSASRMTPAKQSSSFFFHSVSWINSSHKDVIQALTYHEIPFLKCVCVPISEVNTEDQQNDLVLLEG